MITSTAMGATISFSRVRGDDVAIGGKDDDLIWGDKGNDTLLGDRG